MANNELNTKIEELKELKEMQAELKGMIEAIEDQIKQHMTEQGIEEMEVGTHMVRYTTVLSQRFDQTTFKRKLPELYTAYLKQSESKRFSIS